MLTSVYRNDFEDAFRGSQYENCFSGLALITIFDHLENEEPEDYLFEPWIINEEWNEYEFEDMLKLSKVDFDCNTIDELKEAVELFEVTNHKNEVVSYLIRQ